MSRSGHKGDFGINSSVKPDGGNAVTQSRECSKCGAIGEINVRSGNGKPLPAVFMSKKLTQKGWLITKKAAICAACQSSLKLKETCKLPPAPIPSQPREPTALDRRRIIRAIEDNWSDTDARYIGSATDKTIAAEVPGDIPWAWVKNQREELFGAIGHNQDFERALAELKAITKDAQKLSDQSLVMAQSYDDLKRRAEAIIDTLKGG